MFWKKHRWIDLKTRKYHLAYKKNFNWVEVDLTIYFNMLQSFATFIFKTNEQSFESLLMLP